MTCARRGGGRRSSGKPRSVHAGCACRSVRVFVLRLRSARRLRRFPALDGSGRALRPSPGRCPPGLSHLGPAAVRGAASGVRTAPGRRSGLRRPGACPRAGSRTRSASFTSRSSGYVRTTGFARRDAAGSRSPRCGWWPSGSCRAASGSMVRGSCSAPVGLVFCSAQGHSGTRRALRVDEVTVDAGMHVREAIDEAVVDDHAEHLGEGVRFTAVVVSATARAAASCRHLDRLGHAAAVILRSPRRLRRSPEDAPLRPAGALVNRTSPADCRITDPRVSNCWSPMRSAPSGAPRRAGRAAGAGPGAPRLLAGHATAGAALPGNPRRVDVPPRGRPDTNTECRSSQGPCASSVTPNPGRRWWRTAGGTPGRESGVRVGGRARFRSLPAVGLPALSSVRSRQRAAQRRDSSSCVQGPRRLLSLVRHRAPCRCSRPASTRAWLSPRSRYRRRSRRTPASSSRLEQLTPSTGRGAGAVRASGSRELLIEIGPRSVARR